MNILLDTSHQLSPSPPSLVYVLTALSLDT